MQSSTLPETYRAIVAVKLGEPPKIATLPLPKPNANQILVKVAFAPMNPSDIDSQNGHYGLPSGTLVGFEGSGTVVGLGENLKIPFTVGQKVHLRGPGTWGEYIVVNTNAAYPVQGDLSLEQSAAHIVNPGTSLYMARMAIDGGHKAAIHTLGSSSLGRMLIRYCKSKGFPLINIVRRDDYIQELKDEGADYVLNSSAPDFEAKLKELAEKEQATCAFDGIAGDFTSKVVTAQPNGSICYVYGGMGGHAVTSISIMELFKGKRISGHTFVSYFEGLVKEGKEGPFLNEIQSNLGTIFKTSVQKVFKMDDIVEALAYYEKNSSKGKILLEF